MNVTTPEKMGISSHHLLAFYRELEAYGLSTHGVLMSRGESIFTECYWKPFHEKFLHRMYSVSKSFVSVAIGFCQQDGLLSLEDSLESYFPEYAAEPCRHSSRILDLLQMKSDVGYRSKWFREHGGDRAAYYFQMAADKEPDTLFFYDSAAAFMLGALVEKVTGKELLEYLREKFLNDIGFSKEAYFLKCPGGHAWGDSGLVCTARDLWLFARFVLNRGTWQGKRYLNEAYLTAATTPTTPNDPYGFFNHHNVHGYGYQFWGAPEGCFAAKGMGNQLAFCDPAHDFICILNSDNQGNPLGYEPIYRALYTHILPNLGQTLPEDPAAQAQLQDYLAERKLFCLPGNTKSPMAQKISGKTFRCQENPMEIKWFRLDFAEDTGSFTYENAQGQKRIRFGFGYNVFHKFPEEGYSDLVGTECVPGHQYDGAYSADWPAGCTLRIRVQIIDKYFGNLSILFGFRDENAVTVRMTKKAEAFLEEYSGMLNATAE